MLEKKLESIKAKGRFRERHIYKEKIDCASNDYLGFAEDRYSIIAASSALLKEECFAPKASMLVNGYHQAHRSFEKYVAKSCGFEAGIMCGCGYMANQALIAAMPQRDDILIIDEEYHASGIEAAKLSKAKVEFFAHNNANDLGAKLLHAKKTQKKGEIFIVVEGVYSMSGGILDKEIFDVAREFGAYMIVDEAHSVGSVGASLEGIFELHGVTPSEKHIKLGTLGKALGSYGAYILSSELVNSFLQNRAKPIIYSTALSLFDTILGLHNYKKMQKNSARLGTKIKKQRELVAQIIGIHTPSNIFTVEFDTIIDAKKAHTHLLKAGFLTGFIRPPTVKKPLLRVTLRTAVELSELKNMLKALKFCLQ